MSAILFSTTILNIYSKGFIAGIILGGALEGLTIGGNLVFQNGLGLTIKNSLKRLRNQPKTALIKQLTITVYGFIFRGAYYWKDNCLRLGFGGLIFGGAYYRDFMVLEINQQVLLKIATNCQVACKMQHQNLLSNFCWQPRLLRQGYKIG